MKATITIGISASGKSTFAEEWVAKDPSRRAEINRDTVRRQLVEKDGGVFSWSKWNWKREKEVTSIISDLIFEKAKLGCDLIVSDTNLNKSRLEKLTAELEDLGYEVETKEFPVTIEEAWKRDAARVNGVGHSVIANQYEQWLDYIGRKRYVSVSGKTPCILVDIDGTLAHMNGKRGAFDWHMVDVDDLDENVKFVIHSANIHGWSVIILSGRDGCCRELTKEWLKKNVVVYNQLLMRAEGDMRKDTIVKEEIFWQYIAENYNVQFVIDDRPSVIRMWREVGLKTFIVGNPWIEF